MRDIIFSKQQHLESMGAWKSLALAQKEAEQSRVSNPNETYLPSKAIIPDPTKANTNAHNNLDSHHSSSSFPDTNCHSKEYE